MEGIKPEEPAGLGRLLTGMALLVFAMSLVPGMFGGRLGDLDAFVPPPAEGAAAREGGPRLAWMKNEYRAALERARREAKLLFVNFTGYACTNCHWMKSNLFPRPEIAAALGEFVLVELYTDGTDEASRQNQELQLSRFSTVAIPFYVIMDPDEKVIATFPGLTRDAREFLAFLSSGPKPEPAGAATASASSSELPQGLTKLDGGSVALEGKPTLVNFWATWCVPCIQEIPGFNKLHAEFAPKGVTVIGVSMDEEGPEKVKGFLKKHPMEYAVAMGSDKLTAQFRLDQLPVTVMFDKAGKVVQRFEGYTAEAELRAAVEKALR
jgi:thiol:disulfide interchange protein DsbD